MKRIPLHPLWRFWFVLNFIAVPAALAAEGSATGTVEGRVLNSSRDVYVEGAHITVEGTALETFTQPDGSYRLTNVPAGTAMIKVFYTGFPSYTANVAIVAGAVTRHEIDLAGVQRRGDSGKDSEVVRLSEFVVSASREMATAAIAINEQRFAPNTRTVVSSDEFGVPEGGVGEFLKFLPGVTLDYDSSQPRGISLNGVPRDYVPVTIDGFNMAVGGGQKATSRGLQLDMVSMVNTSRIEVIYSPTPESQGSALGGSVNMVPRSSFERSKPEGKFNAYLAMRDNARDFNKTPGPLESPTRKVYPGFDFSYIKPVNARWGFTLSGGRSSNATVEDFISNDWRGSARTTNGGAFPNTTPDSPYLTRTQISNGTKDTTRTSIGGGVDFKLTPNDRISFSFQTYYIDILVTSHNMEYAITGVASFSPTTTRGAVGKGSIQMATTYRDRTNKTSTPTLTWRHDGPVWKADAGLGVSQASNLFRAIDKGQFSKTTSQRTGLTVSFADIFYLRPGTITVADGTTGAPVDPFNINNYALTSAESNAVTSSDLKRGARANVSREFYGRLPLTLKTGVDFSQTVRDQRIGTISYPYVGADGKGSTTPVGSDDSAARFFAPSYSQTTLPFGFGSPQWLDNAAVWKYYTANPTQFPVDPRQVYRQGEGGSKHAEELVSATYLRGDLQLFERRLKLVGGVRAEQTNTKAQGPLTDPTLNYQRDAKGNVILVNGKPVQLATDSFGISKLTEIERAARVNKEYLRFFPSLNASFNIRENLIARAAYYHSIGRPDFDQYTGGVTLPDESVPPGPKNVIQVNNAAIKPWTAKTLNVRLEYYFEGVGQISVGAFQRDFKNFFGDQVFTPTPEFLDLYGLDPAIYGQYQVSTQHNITDTVRMNGVDVSYKQALTFLPYGS